MSRDVIRVLLVEDNDDDVLMLRETLADTGLVRLCHVASNGAAALKFLRAQAHDPVGALPELILLDINMPGKNGFEVLEAVKSDPALRHIPVVVLTTSRREEDVIRSYAHGACSFITKPQGLEQLREVVRQFAGYWATVARVPAIGS